MSGGLPVSKYLWIRVCRSSTGRTDFCVGERVGLEKESKGGRGSPLEQGSRKSRDFWISDFLNP